MWLVSSVDVICSYEILLWFFLQLSRNSFLLFWNWGCWTGKCKNRPKLDVIDRLWTYIGSNVIKFDFGYQNPLKNCCTLLGYLCVDPLTWLHRTHWKLLMHTPLQILSCHINIVLLKSNFLHTRLFLVIIFFSFFFLR